LKIKLLVNATSQKCPTKIFRSIAGMSSPKKKLKPAIALYGPRLGAGLDVLTSSPGTAAE
jgi:hypothetical protein